MHTFVALLCELVVLYSSWPAEALSLPSDQISQLTRPSETGHREKGLFAVDNVLWPGCIISHEYPYKAELFGFGTCALQPCSCQEVRPTSVVWGFAGKCDRAPDQIIDFVVTMRLNRSWTEKLLEYPQKIHVSPTVESESVFAGAMQKEMSKSKWSKQEIPVVEQVGIKLGYMGIQLIQLRNTAGQQCSIYDEAAFMTSSEYQKSMMMWQLPEAFFDSHELTRVSVETRGAFHLIDLFKKLGTTLAHRTVGTVLVSLGQAFQLYEEANWVHCDRSSFHILFRKSALNRDMPGAVIIDQDRTQNLAHASAQDIVLGRRHMLQWYALTVHNVCHEERLSEPYSSCVDRKEFYDLSREQFQQVMRMNASAERENDCKGSQFLAETVVGPALLCSAGEDDCPSYDIAHWAKKLRVWAVKYYGEPFQKQSVLGSDLYEK